MSGMAMDLDRPVCVSNESEVLAMLGKGFTLRDFRMHYGGGIGIHDQNNYPVSMRYVDNATFDSLEKKGFIQTDGKPAPGYPYHADIYTSLVYQITEEGLKHAK